MALLPEVNIGKRSLGPGHPCYFIAEIGSNHNQDYDLALKLIDAAVAAGVDAVKFQTFRASDHYSKRTPGFSYLDGKDTYSLIEQLELDRSWQAGLKKHAEAQGVDFLSSPCDFDAVDELAALGVVANKIASFDLPDLNLIRKVAETGKPVILSTGLADWSDLHRAVTCCREAGNPEVILLQCTSLYPAPAFLSNLKAMKTMAEAFGLVTGYSDHTEGEHIPLAAVALGAAMIEKHFTLDRNLPGPDHPFGIEPDELKALITHIRDVEAAIGDGTKAGPRPEEAEMAEKGRRSLHARTDIPEGTIIEDSMLTAKRPGYGIPVYQRNIVIGRSAKRTILADEWITWDAI